MAIAFVNRAVVVSDSGHAVLTAAVSHTTGNLLTVMVSRQTASAVTVTDTAGNTYTAIGTDIASGVNRVRLYYAYNITGNASNVLTATLPGVETSNFFELTVRQFSGFGASDPFGAFQASSSSGSSLATASIAVTGSEALIFAGMESDSGFGSGGTGFTFNAFNGFFADEFKIVTASEAATATASGGAAHAIAGASFNVGTAGTTRTRSYFY